VKHFYELSIWAAAKYQVGRVALKERMSEDRGEGAVSTAVIVAIVAAAAVALGTAITFFVRGWIGRMNQSCPPGGCPTQ
jgi:hypothetical protein